MSVTLRNPRTGEPERPLRPVDRDTIAALAEGLRTAQRAFGSLAAQERARTLEDLADRMSAASGELLAALASDTGRLHEERMEIDASIALLRRWAREAPRLLASPPPRAADLRCVQIATRRDPYPLVGVISPWNFPLLLTMIDAAPALAAGAAVIAKPSEITPRFAEPLQRIVDSTPGLAAVFRLVEGAQATGRAIVEAVDAVCLTGSVQTGIQVARQAAERLIPAFLELGGKDPAIVLAGADLDRASSAILWGATVATGQSCQSIERIYVEASVADQFISRLVAKARRVTLNWPDPQSGQLGPFIDPRQAQVVADQLADARRRGATVLCGGEVVCLGGGLWMEATVVSDVDHTMALMTQETFGPVMPVQVVSDRQAAIAAANDSAYGLSAAVFARSRVEAEEVAAALQVGAVSINDAALTSMVHGAEKTSRGVSGLGGSRMGPSGLLRFLRTQAMLINVSADPDPWWYR